MSKFVPNLNPKAITVAYVRVSTLAQDHALQKDAIQRLAKTNGDAIDEWMSEKASGKSIDRPILQELRQKVKEGLVKKVYIWRLDRLTRSGISDTLSIVEEFSKNSAELVSVTDGFSLVSTQADIILAVMAWASKMEREAIIERQHAARRRMQEEGRPWGRPSTKFDKERAQALIADKKPLRQVALELGISYSTLWRGMKDYAQPVEG